MRTRASLRTKPWHVVFWANCPGCDCGSIGVQLDGRIVRHSPGGGYVVKNYRCPPDICVASGRRIRPSQVGDATFGSRVTWEAKP